MQEHIANPFVCYCYDRIIRYI